MFKHALKSAVVLAALFVVADASAHATLEKRTATAEGTYKAVMRLSHGCEGQATHTVRVTLPEGFVNAKPMPKPGWTLSTRKARYARSYILHGRKYEEGVVEITWSGGKLQDDWYDEFVFRGTVAGVAPGSVMHFPTTQICANGQHSWSEIATPGQNVRDLKHPAPQLSITAPRGHGGAATPSGSWEHGGSHMRH